MLFPLLECEGHRLLPVTIVVGSVLVSVVRAFVTDLGRRVAVLVPVVISASGDERQQRAVREPVPQAFVGDFDTHPLSW
ncbi:hypothetical protein [Nocardiopsis sp. CNR-923]|uniref:hypothetical protein n=1 Tax=Nocardiopsis sp. CNR-923 TaxID=1904965 RepID=UPI0011815637|nr:hypothetical protein [Nocardiopsis sp. CNR-923]